MGSALTRVGDPLRPLAWSGTPVRTGILEGARNTPVYGASSAVHPFRPNLLYVSPCPFVVTARCRTRSPRPREPREQPLTARSVAAAHRAGARRRQRRQQRARAFAGRGARGAEACGSPCAPPPTPTAPTTSRAPVPNTCPSRAAATPASVAALRAACVERRPRARARAARRLPGRPRAQRAPHSARRHLAQPRVRRGRRAPSCCGCWSGGSRRPPPSSSGPRPTSWTGPGGAGPGTPGSSAVALPAPRGALGRDESDRLQDAGRTRCHGPPVAHGCRRAGAAPGVRRPAGRRTRVARSRSRAASRDRGGGAAAGGVAGPHRERGAAGPAHRAARRRERPARSPRISHCCPAVGSRAPFSPRRPSTRACR